jgi:DnaK suppressor protein
MKKAESGEYRDRLLSLRARLRGDVSTMADVALRKAGMQGGDTSAMPIHMAELGSDNFEQEFTLSLMQTEEDTLTLIEQALQRIEEGHYGQCVECDGAIPKTRLNALPFTPMCIRCAEKIENH